MTRNRPLVLLPLLLLLASEARAGWPYATITEQSNYIHQDTRVKDLDPFFSQSSFFPSFGDDVKVTTKVQRDPARLAKRRAKGAATTDYSCFSSQGGTNRGLGRGKDKFNAYGDAVVTKKVSASKNCDFYSALTTFKGGQKQPEGSSVNVTTGVQRLPPGVDPECYDLNTLCLHDGRFKVTLDWSDFDGVSGEAVPMASGFDAGLFSFFDADNWEMVVKVLDACDVRGSDHFWVFYASTTNVEYTLTVTDTKSDEVRVYGNPLGVQSPAITDTSAFATCP
ncbi:MAG: hypothetical protein IH936_05085 [Acidobacteria bacterium]|nr:hypothetical protein [Acidobacteriota bacterium]